MTQVNYQDVYAKKMSTGQLFLKPNMERQNAKDSRPPYALQPPAAARNQGKSDTKKKSGHKKKSGKGDVFRIHGNTINGDKADKAGVFGFGNKYIGRKKQVEESSTEEESDSSEDEE